MIAYILISIVILISFLPKVKKEYWLGGIEEKLSSFNLTATVLLVWIALGFFLKLDFTQLLGCVFYDENIFHYNNVGFSSFSFLLILIAKFSKSKRIQQFLLLLELVFWLFKLIYYKGGYAMGISGSYPYDFVVFYDMIGFLLRLKLLSNLLKLKILKESSIYIMVIAVITIKIFIFPFPHDLFWETMHIEREIGESKSLIKGSWHGTIEYDSTWTDTLQRYRLDTISEEFKHSVLSESGWTIQDSTMMYVVKEREKSILFNDTIKIHTNLQFESDLINCQLDFYSGVWGELIISEKGLDSGFRIYKLDSDSLIILMTLDIGKGYIHKLKKLKE